MISLRLLDFFSSTAFTLGALTCRLGSPHSAVNWIISYFAGRTDVVKCSCNISLSADINTSIVQGLGNGPMLLSSLVNDLI